MDLDSGVLNMPTHRINSTINMSVLPVAIALWQSKKGFWKCLNMRAAREPVESQSRDSVRTTNPGKSTGEVQQVGWGQNGVMIRVA